MSWTAADHSFVICAYGDSPYLRDCLRSLRRQTVKSRVLMATSTPNDAVRALAREEDVPLFVNESAERGIAADWDFALRCADAPLVTLAHQDDVYLPPYTQTMLESLSRARDPILFSSAYGELRGEAQVYRSRLLNIKRLLCLPMRTLPRSVTARRLSLALGNPICCPSVTYVKARIAGFPFSRELHCDLDWDAWERLSRLPGSFVFSPAPLLLHRIHPASETSRILGDRGRNREDLVMFRRFWPEGVARWLAKKYAASEESNKL